MLRGGGGVDPVELLWVLNSYCDGFSLVVVESGVMWWWDLVIVMGL